LHSSTTIIYRTSVPTDKVKHTTGNGSGSGMMNMKSSTDSCMWGATYITLFTWLKFGSKAITLTSKRHIFFCWFHEKKKTFFLVRETNNITRDLRLQPESR
jgi:hypothetical protein